MPASTPVYGFPYPTGTDRVMDGDNAMGALALAVEQALTAREAAGELGYAEVTANQTGISTMVDLTGLAVTVNVPANRRVKITGYGKFVSATNGDIIRMNIAEGAAILNLGQVAAAASQPQSCPVIVVVTPTPGAHTYKLTANRAAGGGAVSSHAAPGNPAFILVEDIGSAP